MMKRTARTALPLVAWNLASVAWAAEGGHHEGATKEVVAHATRPDFSPYAGRDYPTRVFFGDTHLHTAISVDAGTMCRVSQEDAFRFARGEEISTTFGLSARLSRPLDFLVIADHAGMCGLMPPLLGGDPEVLAMPIGKKWYDALKSGDRDTIFATAIEIVGFEWTAIGGDNLHRNVLFRGSSGVANRTLPFFQFDSKNPEKLWTYLADFEKETGSEVMAIPHNGNLSNSRMFTVESFDGKPLTKQLAALRTRFETVVETTRIKGDIEAHPFLSPIPSSPSRAGSRPLPATRAYGRRRTRVRRSSALKRKETYATTGPRMVSFLRRI